MRLICITLLLILAVACGKKEIRNESQSAATPTEILQVAGEYFQNADYENAFRAYGVIYYDYPTSREYIDAALGLSKCYGQMENYEKEFEILYALLKENLIPTKVPQIYNSIAQFYEKSAGISEQLTGEGSSDYQTAIGYYVKALEYPNSSDQYSRSLAQYKIGSLYQKLDDYEKAIEAYQLTVNGYTNTEWALRAEQNIAEIRNRARLRQEYQQSGLLPTDTTAAPAEDLYQYQAPVDTSDSAPEEDMPVPDIEFPADSTASDSSR